LKAAIIKKYRLVIKTMGYVGWSLFWLLLWDVAVTVDFMLFLTAKINLPLMPLTLLGSALVVLISFRNSSAYNRWWEARTLWGGDGQQFAQLCAPGADPAGRPRQ
jgi:putative membrane protein